MEEGFLKLSRRFFSTAMWNDAREFSECEAWIDLLRSARFEATGKAYSELIGGREVSYSRGQYPASISFLSKRWKWSDKKVRCFLAKLKKEGMITVCNRQGMNVITICDYDCYDGREDEDGEPSVCPDGTQDGAQDGTPERLPEGLSEDNLKESERTCKGRAKGKGKGIDTCLNDSELQRLRAELRAGLRAELRAMTEEIAAKLDEFGAKGRAKGIDTELEYSGLQGSRAGLRAGQEDFCQKTENLGQGKGRKKKNINNNINNIPPTPPKGEGLHQKARSVFERHYRNVFGENYYWTAKDAGSMSQLLKKLEFQRTQKGMDNTEESMLYALEYLLSSIREGWVFENFSVTNINSKFNEIVAKAKNITQSGYDTGIILRDNSPEKYKEGW